MFEQLIEQMRCRPGQPVGKNDFRSLNNDHHPCIPIEQYSHVRTYTNSGFLFTHGMSNHQDKDFALRYDIMFINSLIRALQEAEKEQNIVDEPKNKMLNKLLEVGQAGGLTPEAIGLKLAELILEREKAEDMAGKYAQCQSELAAKQNDLAECNQEIEQLKDVASGYHEEL